MDRIKTSIVLVLVTLALCSLAGGCGGSTLATLKSDWTGKPVLDNIHPPAGSVVPVDTCIWFDIYNGYARAQIYTLDEKGRQQPIRCQLFREKHSNFERQIYTPTQYLPSRTQIFVEIDYYNSDYRFRHKYSFRTE